MYTNFVNLILVGAIALPGFLLPSTIFASDDFVPEVTIQRDDLKKQIASLDFKVKSAEFTGADKNGRQSVYVVIEAKFSGAGQWRFEQNNKGLDLKPDRTFWFAGGFTLPRAAFTITAISTNQERISERITVNVVQVKKPAIFDFHALLGTARVRYHDDKTQIDQISIGGSFGVIYHQNQNWHADFDLFSDLFALPTRRGNPSAKFVQGQFDLGYNFDLFWHLNLDIKFGMSALALYGAHGDIGFNALLVPELYPVLKLVSKTSEFYGSFYYIPTGKTLSFTSTEILWGTFLGYILKNKDAHQWIFSGKYNYLQYKPRPANSIVMSTIGLAVGYGW